MKHATPVVEPSNTETVGTVEPIEPQVASEVQQVDDSKDPEAEDEEVTTKKPGFWSRLGTKIKNKIG